MDSRENSEIYLFAAEIGDQAPSVDLHGCDRDEAKQQVERLTQDAFMEGERTIKIIHGHGTGALRREIQSLLSSHPLIETFRDSTRSGEIGAVTVALVAPKN